MPDIDYRTELPDQQQFADLFATTGWDTDAPIASQQLFSAISCSWYLVAAYDRERLIGFGRVISDGALHALIVDLIVHPSYQGQQIGRALLSRLMEACAHIHDVQLFCARGKAGFYRKFGFVERPADAPGMQLQRG